MYCTVLAGVLPIRACAQKLSGTRALPALLSGAMRNHDKEKAPPTTPGEHNTSGESHRDGIAVSMAQATGEVLGLLLYNVIDRPMAGIASANRHAPLLGGQNGQLLRSAGCAFLSHPNSAPGPSLSKQALLANRIAHVTRFEHRLRCLLHSTGAGLLLAASADALVTDVPI